MNFVDILIIILILYGAFKGFKYGGFSAAINLAGTLLVFILAYFIKNPLSEYMYLHWPFISFGGIFSGISVFNILFYECIAYIVCVVILSIILKIVLKVTGIVDKILDMTIILSFPSKILGILCGAFQYFIYVFIILFIMAQIPFSQKYYNNSFLGEKIITHTPGLSLVTKNIYSSISEVYDICFEHKNDSDKTNANLLSLAVLLKYQVVTTDGVELLIDNDKLKIKNIEEFLAEYKEKGEFVIDKDLSNKVNSDVNNAVNTITNNN